MCSMRTPYPSNEPILTVTQLNSQVRFLLEKSFPAIFVEGEMSNLSKPTSGHWYFSLKDNKAQVRCAMFKMQNRGVNFEAKEGAHVLVKAKVALYEERGDFQLIVESMTEAGLGALQQAFDTLKMKLGQEGLFNEERKKSLPSLPKCLGVITSSTGAALHDILQVLKHRFPSIPVIVYPTLVQGNEAAPNIVRMIELANARQECDILILARGGGSLEDLWPFNEEIVARAISHSQLPIITGVGHQTDFTIADFVADCRAPTPSAAAAKAVPDQEELLAFIKQKNQRLKQCLFRQYELLAQKLDGMNKRLLQTHPKKQLAEKKSLIQHLEITCFLLLQNKLHAHQHRLQQALSKLPNLRYQIERHLSNIEKNKLIQTQLLSLIFEKTRSRFQMNIERLHAFSPLATLARSEER